MWIKKDISSIKKALSKKKRIAFVCGVLFYFPAMYIVRHNVILNMIAIARLSVLHFIIIVLVNLLLLFFMGLFSVWLFARDSTDSNYACIDCGEVFTYSGSACPKCKSENIDKIKHLSWID